MAVTKIFNLIFKFVILVKIIYNIHDIGVAANKHFLFKQEVLQQALLCVCGLVAMSLAKSRLVIPTGSSSFKVIMNFYFGSLAYVSDIDNVV